MAPPPSFRYFLADEYHPVFPDDALWRRTLPDLHPGRVNPGALSISYGEYFTAVAEFVAEQDFAAIIAAVVHETGKSIVPDQIKAVSVFLEKHGAVYHPSRISVQTRAFSTRVQMAVNVAVSETGRRLLQGEHGTLEQLFEDVPNPWIPKVFGIGKIAVDSERFLPMFAAQWFSGFHEFHPSIHPEEGEIRLRLWHPDNPDCFLKKGQAFAVYREVAEILTAFYRPETFEQVARWHHAAGDFIVRISDAGQAVLRLITVRAYSPMLDIQSVDASVIMEGLVIFLLNLSIRNRIDRLDGVGEYVWASDEAVTATLQGAFDGLNRRVAMGRVPDALPGVFHQYLAAHTRQDLMEIADALTQRLPETLPELPLIRRHLHSHVSCLVQAVSDFTDSSK